LIPLEGQGQLVTREGVLKPAPFRFGRPSDFRLVKIEGNRITTICYVRGEPKLLSSHLSQPLRLRGREYWPQGAREPMLVVEELTPLPAR
jgi:hypothetical protein